jgi:hypothetical protein
MKHPEDLAPHIRLIVTSCTATLAQLSRILGESELAHHDLGTARDNGIVRQQSVWFGRWRAEAGEAVDALEETLQWLAMRKAALMSLDSSAFLKVVCTVTDGTLALSPSLAAKLAELDVLLLVEVAGPAGEA